MFRKLAASLLMMCLFLFAVQGQAMFPDDPWLTKVKSEFEYLQDEGESVLEWDIDIWSGRDLSKFWIKSSGEYADSEFEDAKIELVYSHAISAYWDQQFGIRHDFRQDTGPDSRNWISYGYVGTAPYFIEIDARLFIGEESSSQILIELERELMITQEWVLTPEMDIVVNGRSNSTFEEGSGLAEIEFSLRLGYEPDGNRKFQPFFGLITRQLFGATRAMAKQNGSSGDDFAVMIGLHSWF
ncbi:MAG: copper resistance protein B [Pseudomonadota bacterium]